MGQAHEEAPKNIFPRQLDSRSFINSSPEFTLPRTALEQVASWSLEDDAPITLRELISSRFPLTAQRLGIPLLEATAEPVRRVEDLSNDELKKITCIHLGTSLEETTLMIGKKVYTDEDLIQHVNEGTEVGQRIVASHRRSMYVLEQRIEKGKLIGITD